MEELQQNNEYELQQLKTELAEKHEKEIQKLKTDLEKAQSSELAAARKSVVESRANLTMSLDSLDVEVHENIKHCSTSVLDKGEFSSPNLGFLADSCLKNSRASKEFGERTMQCCQIALQILREGTV